jgi:hypothetical protein
MLILRRSALPLLVAVLLTWALPAAAVQAPEHRHEPGDGGVAQGHSTKGAAAYVMETNVVDAKPMPMTPFDLTMSIMRENEVVKGFATLHEAPLHLVVIRRDLQHFMHLHPRLDTESGVFTLEGMIFPEAGPYRIFADFLPAGEQGHHGMVLSEDVVVGLAQEYEPVPVVLGPMSGLFEGYPVSLDVSPPEPVAGRQATLSFLVMHEGRPITAELENYLGSLGHMVILREGDLDFQHLHANEQRRDRPAVVTFTATFPTPGKYKLFTQFQDRGRVLTTEFVLEVPESGSR